MQKKKILYIEDSPVMTKIVVKIFSQLSEFSIVTCESVSEARKTLQNNYFNLVIFDNDLPDGSGLSLIEELVSNGVITHNTCLLAVTARSSTDYSYRCLKLNIDQVMSKPFSTSDFLKSVRNLLGS